MVGDAPLGESLERLMALGRAFGQPDEHRSFSSQRACVVAWASPMTGCDAGASAVWTGRIDSELTTIDAHRAGELEGCFALLALRADALIAARSLFGGRPLYYATIDGGRRVFACSRVAPLSHLLGDGLEPDADRLAAYAVCEPAADPTATALRRIRRVLPGETIAFTPPGRPRSVRASLQPVAPTQRSHREWARQIRAEIDDAVARATNGHDRIALLLSGGLDSSAILASLTSPADPTHRPRRQSVTAYTLDFDAINSDRPYFAALVEATGVAAHRVTPEDAERRAFATMVIDGAPRPWATTALDVEILGRTRDAGASCVLTGLGGDCFWDLELDSIGERALRGQLWSALRAAIRLKGAYWLPTPWARVRGLVGLPLKRAILPHALRDAVRPARAARAVRFPRWAGPRVRSFLRGHIERVLESIDRTTGRGDRMNEIARSSTIADAVDGLAQVELAAGAVETHVFLDVRLARFLAGVPPDVVLANDWVRGGLRMAFRDVWPRLITQRPHKGGFAPATAVANEGLRRRGAVDKISAMRALGDLGIVEPRAFRAAFADALRPGGDLSYAWPVLVLEAFASGIAPDGARRGVSS